MKEERKLLIKRTKRVTVERAGDVRCAKHDKDRRKNLGSVIETFSHLKRVNQHFIPKFVPTNERRTDKDGHDYNNLEGIYEVPS